MNYSDCEQITQIIFVFIVFFIFIFIFFQREGQTVYLRLLSGKLSGFSYFGFINCIIKLVRIRFIFRFYFSFSFLLLYWFLLAVVDVGRAMGNMKGGTNHDNHTLYSDLQQLAK